MMDLLGAGNPYMARRFAEGGEVEELYMRPETAWRPNLPESYVQARPELGKTLAELQAEDPFYATPGYINLRKQLAEVTSGTQREREEYGKKMQALEDQWRSMAGLSEAPELIRNPIVEQLRTEYETSIAPARERAIALDKHYQDVANRITNYLETARPGQALELPNIPFARTGFDKHFRFVLDDPNKPFTYEQRKAYTDQGYSVVGRDVVSNYLQNDILRQQQKARESIDYYSDPNAYMRGREKDYEERLAEALRGYRTAEQQRIEAQQQELKNQIIPLVDKSYQTQQDLRSQMDSLRRSFVPMNRPSNVLVTAPEQQVPVTAAPAPAPTPPVAVPQPVLPGYATPAPQIPVSNLTPQPMPGVTTPQPAPVVTAPPSIGGVPQPSFGIFGSQSALPAYQTQASSPTAQAQQPQQQIQYGPIGQGAVGQTNLLNTLLANQQDPTKVSLLGFDNPYLMKPFG